MIGREELAVDVLDAAVRLLGCTVEIPYANANGCEVNAESAREFGRDLAVALMKFLQDEAGKAVAK